MQDYVRHNMTFLITVFPNQKKGSGYLRIIGFASQILTAYHI